MLTYDPNDREVTFLDKNLKVYGSEMRSAMDLNMLYDIASH